MDEYDYFDTESEPELPFAVVRFFMRVFSARCSGANELHKSGRPATSPTR